MTGVAPGLEVLVLVALSVLLLGAVIRWATKPLLAELRSIRMDLGLPLLVEVTMLRRELLLAGGRQPEEAPTP